ncbi:MAG: aminotransferase class III-fold pyridoxal phosphate-dependent enzyme, partial [Chloroflexota bacterium]|nr:aminotransferase class III-fold pyridoxal phosphate-dependent enzyme [Chloroflexota bacterium]
ASYNELATVEACFKAFPNDIAGVIVEPVAGNMGVVPPAPGFLQGLRELAQRHGALLILDEVITGFRVSYGGAQALYGIRADITTLGKVIGGGLPVGAYGGRRDIMQTVAPLGPMYQAGTLSGNPLAVQAGIAALKTLRQPGTYEVLERLAARLEKGMRDAAKKTEQSVTVNRVGSILTGFFNPGPVATVAQVESSDSKAYAAAFHKLLARGVYFAPSQYEAAFVSLAHTEADIDKTVAAVREALAS